MAYSLPIDSLPIDAAPPVSAARRRDIQVLRAYAITCVLAQHFHVPGVPGGFLGVDAFFVISGYLMAGLITQAMDASAFTFQGFYLRRAHRLLPAAATTFAVTALAAPLFLDGYEYKAFFVQLLGAVTFTTNFVLWEQTDYFGGGAALKPLLHCWSLAVEEQFYLLLPLLLWLSPRHRRAEIIGICALVSFALCLWVQPRSPSASFYILPSRAWEPFLGCFVALLTWRQGVVVPEALRWLATLFLALAPFCYNQAGHPGWAALAVCLATGVLLVPTPRQPGIWSNPLVALGDRSYSLYLVHWPLIAFVNNIYLTTLPWWMFVALALTTTVLAELQFRLVERVTAPRWFGAKAVLGAVVVMVVTLFATFLVMEMRPAASFDRAPNMGLGYACSNRAIYTPTMACASGPRPALLLWGDSLAMHLEPGLDMQTPGGVAQATRWVCGPLLGMAPINATYSKQWARGCLAWNRSVLLSLGRTPSIRVVVLSSLFSQYVPEAEPGWSTLIESANASHIVPRDRERLIAALESTVRAIHATGRRVVLVTPPPSAGVDSGRCLARRGAGLVSIGMRPDCRFTRADYLRYSAPVRSVLEEVARRGIVPIIDFDPVLCSGSLCSTSAGGLPLYRDDVHLSIDGSRYVAGQMQLADRIRREAR